MISNWPKTSSAPCSATSSRIVWYCSATVPRGDASVTISLRCINSGCSALIFRRRRRPRNTQAPLRGQVFRKGGGKEVEGALAEAEFRIHWHHLWENVGVDLRRELSRRRWSNQFSCLSHVPSPVYPVEKLHVTGGVTSRSLASMNGKRDSIFAAGICDPGGYERAESRVPHTG